MNNTILQELDRLLMPPKYGGVGRDSGYVTLYEDDSASDESDSEDDVEDEEYEKYYVGEADITSVSGQHLSPSTSSFWILIAS